MCRDGEQWMRKMYRSMGDGKGRMVHEDRVGLTIDARSRQPAPYEPGTPRRQHLSKQVEGGSNPPPP